MYKDLTLFIKIYCLVVRKILAEIFIKTLFLTVLNVCTMTWHYKKLIKEFV